MSDLLLRKHLVVKAIAQEVLVRGRELMNITQSPIYAKQKEVLDPRPEARTSSCTSEQQSFFFLTVLLWSYELHLFFPPHFPPENWTSFRRNLLSAYSVT